MLGLTKKTKYPESICWIDNILHVNIIEFKGKGSSNKGVSYGSILVIPNICLLHPYTVPLKTFICEKVENNSSLNYEI